MTFSPEERKQAASVHIETLIQQVTGSQIQVNSPGATQRQDISAEQLANLRTLLDLIEECLRRADNEDNDTRELHAEVATLRAQVESPKPKRAVLSASLASLRHVLEGAAGEVLATHLPQAFALVTGLLSSMT